MRAHGMLNPKYARLIARWAWLKLRWRGRLQTDGLCFVGPGVMLEIGRGAALRLGRWSWIGHGTKIRVHEGEVEIGAKSVLGQECTISAFQHVSIGRECIVADRVMLIDFDHGVVEIERPIRLQGIYKRDVRVGNNCWIGYGACILRGVDGRRQRDRRHLDGRHQGRARQRGRRRRAGAGAADARRAGVTALGIEPHGRRRSNAALAASTSASASRRPMICMPDRQPVASRRGSSRRVAGEVGEVGQAPADQRVDRDALDLARPDGVAVAGVRHRQARERRRDQQVVVGEHALDRVEDLGADRLVALDVEHGQPVADVEPVQVLGRQVVAMVGSRS